MLSLVRVCYFLAGFSVRGMVWRGEGVGVGLAVAGRGCGRVIWRGPGPGSGPLPKSLPQKIWGCARKRGSEVAKQSNADVNVVGKVHEEESATSGSECASESDSECGSGCKRECHMKFENA